MLLERRHDLWSSGGFGRLFFPKQLEERHQHGPARGCTGLAPWSPSRTRGPTVTPGRLRLDRGRRRAAIVAGSRSGAPAVVTMDRPQHARDDLEKDIWDAVHWMDHVELGMAIAGALFLILTVAWSALP